MVFATAGWAWGNAPQTTYGFTPALLLLLYNKFSGSGAVVGAGLEYAITRNWLARVEYRYTDLGKPQFRGPRWLWLWRERQSDHRQRYTSGCSLQVRRLGQGSGRGEILIRSRTHENQSPGIVRGFCFLAALWRDVKFTPILLHRT